MKRLLIAALLALLVSGSALCESNTNADGDNTSQPKALDSKADFKPAAVAGGDAKAGSEHKEEQCRYKEPGWFTEFYCFFALHDKFWVSFGTLVLAAFTIILGIATAILAYATRRLVNGADDTAQRQLRAYLNMEFGGVLINSPTQESVSAWIRIKNLGSTPAYKASGWMQFSIRPTNDIPFDGTGESENETSIGPSGEFNLMSTLSFTDKHMQAVKNKTFSMFMWGRFDYIDAFKKPRYLTFRGLMNGDPGTITIDGEKSLGWGFAPTADGNDED